MIDPAIFTQQHADLLAAAYGTLALGTIADLKAAESALEAVHVALGRRDQVTAGRLLTRAYRALASAERAAVQEARVRREAAEHARTRRRAHPRST
jgi:phospholipase/lecithinase/hemolysin